MLKDSLNDFFWAVSFSHKKKNKLNARINIITRDNFTTTIELPILKLQGSINFFFFFIEGLKLLEKTLALCPCFFARFYLRSVLRPVVDHAWK